MILSYDTYIDNLYRCLQRGMSRIYDIAGKSLSRFIGSIYTEFMRGPGIHLCQFCNSSYYPAALNGPEAAVKPASEHESQLSTSTRIHSSYLPYLHLAGKAASPRGAAAATATAAAGGPWQLPRLGPGPEQRLPL